MALVNFLKFSNGSGAIISDEEYWNVFFRKRMHGDNLHQLLSPEESDQLGVQVVYGSVGYPSIHREVVEDARKAVKAIISEGDCAKIMRVKDVARIAFDCLQDAIRRRIDQKMRLFYGFDTSDLNAGQFEFDGESWQIAQPEILTQARKLASRESRDTLLKVVLDAKAAVFGFDADGITGYYLAGENSIMGYVHEGFEAIGSGKYASGLVFGNDFKAKTLKMRQDGYDPATGIYELVDSAFLAGEHFKEVGGNYNFVILNRDARDPSLRYRQIFDETARLTMEIVRAVRAGFVTRDKGINLIDKLIFKNQKLEKVEQELFKASIDEFGLELILRGYKSGEVKELLKGRSK